MSIKNLTEAYQTSDGKLHASLTGAERHQGVYNIERVIRNAAARCDPTSSFYALSWLVAESLYDAGARVEPKECDSSSWTGSRK